MLAGELYGYSDPFTGSKGWLARYGDQEVSQFRGAELIGEKWNISRDEMEDFAVESHLRAIKTRCEGRFEREILPFDGIISDEGLREPNMENPLATPSVTKRAHYRRPRQPDIRWRNSDPHCQ